MYISWEEEHTNIPASCREYKYDTYTCIYVLSLVISKSKPTNKTSLLPGELHTEGPIWMQLSDLDDRTDPVLIFIKVWFQVWRRSRAYT